MASELFAGLEVKGETVQPTQAQAQAQTQAQAQAPQELSPLFAGLQVGDQPVQPVIQPVIQPEPLAVQPIIQPAPGAVPVGLPLVMESFRRVPETAPPTSMLEAGARGFIRGAETVGEGILQRGAQALQFVGIDTEDFLRQLEISRGIQQTKFQVTQQAFPISAQVGEVVGEAAALPIPAARLTTAALGAGVIGGLRFGEEGTGFEFAKNILTDATFGLAGQVVADKAVSLVKKAARSLGITKIPDNLFAESGALKPEAEQFFKKEGIDISELSEKVLADVQLQPEGADVAQALRVAQAKELGVTELTSADISQKFDAQQAEFNLARQRGTPEAEALRQQKAAQNQQLVAAADAIVSKTGGDAGKLQAGQTLQDALGGFKQNRREAISQLYSIAEKEAGVVIPVSQEKIASAFTDQDFIFGLDPDTGGKLKAIKKQLEAFSVLPPEILSSAADVAKIRPLTIGSANELRKRVNSIINLDPKTQAALIPIKNSIDDAIDEISISSDLGDDARRAFQNARQSRIEFAKTFEQKDIVQQLTSFKPGTGTPQIPHSIAFDKIMNSTARFENIKLVKAALTDAGDEGLAAWDNFRATAAAELIGKALTTGKTATGDFRFSGANFNKALKAIGDDTLKVIFSKPGELARIKQLGRISRDVTILQDGVFTPSGAQIENAMQKISGLGIFKLSPVANAVVNEGAEQLRKGARRRELSKVINPTIDIDLANELGTMTNNAVNALRLLGLSGQRKIREEENK